MAKRGKEAHLGAYMVKKMITVVVTTGKWGGNLREMVGRKK